MEHYNQPYSEIIKIPASIINFLIELYNIEAQQEQKEMKKLQSGMKKPRRRFR